MNLTKSIFCLSMITSLIGAPAFAAESGKTTASVVKTAGKKKRKPAPQASADAILSSVSTTPAEKATTPAVSGSASAVNATALPTAQSPATPEATNTAALSTAAPSPKKFSASFFTRHDFQAASLYTKNLLGRTLNRGTVGYKLNDSTSVSYSQEFSSAYATSQKPSSATMQDGFIQVLNSKLASFPNEVNSVGFLRAYLPFGESARFVDKHRSILIGYADLNKSFGKLDVAYQLIGSYVVNSQDYYFSGSQVVANGDFGVENYIDLTYNVSPTLEITATTGIDDSWNRPAPGLGITRETGFNLEAGLRYKPTKQVSLYTSYVQRNVLESNNAIDWRNDKDMKYRAMLSVAL